MKPIIEIDVDDEAPRQNYRVTPHEDDPVELKVAGVKVKIIDISAKGVAFYFNGEAKKSEYPILLTFETDRAYEMQCSLKLIRRDKPEYSGEFIDLSERDVSRLTSLIVDCQKRAIHRGKLQQNEESEES
jgi:hypothetical protein